MIRVEYLEEQPLRTGKCPGYATSRCFSALTRRIVVRAKMDVESARKGLAKCRSRLRGRQTASRQRAHSDCVAASARASRLWRGGLNREAEADCLGQGQNVSVGNHQSTSR